MENIKGGRAIIPFNFIYYRPKSLNDAVYSFQEIYSKGESAVYYAGGSEIITMCRTGSIKPQAVIDIKDIPECNLLTVDDQNLHIGSVCTLNQIKESKLFPLLGLACGRIADHTNQCRITLGGNLSGSIIYRETSLPLLLSDAKVTLFSSKGQRTVPFQSIFKRKMELMIDEFIVQVHVPIWALSAGHAHIKKTANEKIDYPLVSVSAIFKDDRLRIAFSGVCSYPFRSEQIELVLNDKAKSVTKRAELAFNLLPEPICRDAEGTGEYRAFVLKNTLESILEDWENGTI